MALLLAYLPNLHPMSQPRIKLAVGRVMNVKKKRPGLKVNVHILPVGTLQAGAT